MPPSPLTPPAQHSTTDAPAWLKRRGYAHFDYWPAVSFARAYVESPIRVARHGFWPLQKFELVTKRWRRDPASGGRVRDDKRRPIMYAAHLDAAIYGRYAALLHERVESVIADRGLHSAVLAYRSVDRASNVKLAFAAFEEIAARSPCEVLAIDVRSFFDELDHTLLKRAVEGLLGQPRLPDDWYRVLRSVTKYAFVSRDDLRAALKRDVPRRGGPGIRICNPCEFREKVRPYVQRNEQERGIPQGTPISAVLANAYMLSLDMELSTSLRVLDATYRRYSDDILVICPVGCAIAAEGKVLAALGQLRLAHHPGKTGRFSVEGNRVFAMHQEGSRKGRSQIDYLGLTWDGRRVGIRNASLARFVARMSSAVRGGARGAESAGATTLRRRKLYRNFSHLGPGPKRVGGGASSIHRGNFIRYALNAAALTGSLKCRAQVARYWNDLEARILSAESSLREKG